jgi:RHS repeat-associated protein
MVLGGQAQDLPVLQMKYDSFGNIIEENGSFEIPFRFAGGIWDKDTKLTRFGVRDYDSETGRWTSKEPLGFDGARNFYVYVGNDPIMLWDLTGLFPDLFKYHRTYGNWLGGKIFEVKQKVVKLAQKTWNNVPCEAKSMAKDFLGLNDDSDDTAVITGDNLIIPHKKLAHEYEHAPHFGINGNWNKINAKAFEDALRLHIDNPLSLPFQGTYRGTIYVTHYFNPTNNNNIMVD